MLRIILLGYGHLGTALLEGLSREQDVVVDAVFRWSSREGQARLDGYFDESERALAELVNRLGVDDLKCESANSYDFTVALQRRKPDILLIGAWGEIIKPHILEFPDLTIINCHPSLLPAHRGANPYSSVIRHGDIQTGVTFHLVTPGVDEGPVILQEPVPVQPHDTGGDLRCRCADTARGMVPDLIRIVTGALSKGEAVPAAPQNEAAMSYYKPLSLEDARLDWTADPATLQRQIRSLQPWLDCFGFVGSRMITFKTIAYIEEETPAEPGTILPGTILKITPQAVRVASAKPGLVLDLGGYRLQMGQSLLPERISGMLAKLPVFGLLRRGQVIRSQPQQ